MKFFKQKSTRVLSWILVGVLLLAIAILATFSGKLKSSADTTGSGGIIITGVVGSIVPTGGFVKQVQGQGEKFNGIPGAFVTIYSGDTGVVTPLSTLSDGSFATSSPMPFGTYLLSVSAEGYNSVSKTFICDLGGCKAVSAGSGPNESKNNSTIVNAATNVAIGMVKEKIAAPIKLVNEVIGATNQNNNSPAQTVSGNLGKFGLTKSAGNMGIVTVKALNEKDNTALSEVSVTSLVQLTQTPTKGNGVCTTDVDGICTLLTNVPAGDYRALFKKTGFVSTVQAMYLKTDSTDPSKRVIQIIGKLTPIVQATHLACNTSTKKCEATAGAGANQCTSDNDCVVTPPPQPITNGSTGILSGPVFRYSTITKKDVIFKCGNPLNCMFSFKLSPAPAGTQGSFSGFVSMVGSLIKSLGTSATAKFFILPSGNYTASDITLTIINPRNGTQVVMNCQADPATITVPAGTSAKVHWDCK